MEGIKLEIGSELRPTEGYEHLDIIAYPHVEIVADARDIPVADETYIEVYSHWVLEHFAKNDIIPLLKEWRRILVKGGKIRAVTNNQESINQSVASGEITWMEWSYLTFGNDTKTLEGSHKVGFSQKSIKEYFLDAGLTDIVVEATWGCRGKEGELGCPALIVEAIR